MKRKILVILGHPDPAPERFCRALARAYEDGARQAGHEVRLVDLATIYFPLLRGREAFERDPPPESLAEASQSLHWAEHLVFIFPLWLGTMPALLKGFLEQVMRPGVAFAYPEKGKPGFTKSLLVGRSARVIVTMGMPGFVYRVWFLAHGLAGMRRGILHFVGIRPVRETLYGMVEAGGDEKRQRWIEQVRALGARAI